ncbi:MAG: HDOD domain-containing protein [Planctomycetaceae bacterium]|jgi:HD-like signal output (HDOD) protein|nr:HDOD domain-containing protein [Planctomycetaceae bacterium]
MISDKNYRKLTKKIKDSCLLALPQSAVKILELSKDPDNGPQEFSAAIATDLGLTSQILKFVNSSYFGFRHKITTIPMALSLVYGRTIKNFILWNAVFALLPNPKCGQFDLRKICQDALRRGIFAKIIASHIPDIDPDEMLLNAMFQDMALPILVQTWPAEYADILTRKQNEGKRLSELEQSVFGWTHAVAGAFLVDEWGFGDEFSACIENHLAPDFNFNANTATIEQIRNTIVGISSFLPSVMDSEWDKDEADLFFQGYSRLHRPTMPRPDDLFEQTDQQITEMSEVVHLEEIPKSLVEFHKEYVTRIGV